MSVLETAANHKGRNAIKIKCSNILYIADISNRYKCFYIFTRRESWNHIKIRHNIFLVTWFIIVLLSYFRITTSTWIMLWQYLAFITQKCLFTIYVTLPCIENTRSQKQCTATFIPIEHISKYEIKELIFEYGHVFQVL